MEWAAELLEAYRCGDMDAIRQCALKNVAPVELEFKLPRRPEDFEDAFREKEMSDENRCWLCFDIEMQWAERSGCGDAQRIAWKTEAEKARDELAAALIDDLPKALDGKRFELMGFDDDLVKVITQRIEACSASRLHGWTAFTMRRRRNCGTHTGASSIEWISIIAHSAARTTGRWRWARCRWRTR